MTGFSVMLIVFLFVNITLISFLILRPSATNTRGGKIFAFASLFILPVFLGIMGTDRHMENAKSAEFCLSCHEMGDYGKSLRIDDRAFIPSVHYQNNMISRDEACFTCHTDYTMFGDYNAKLRGLKHVYVHYLGKPPEQLKLYTPYSNRECLHCHEGARSFEEGATHNQDPNTLPQVRANQLSCLSSECHSFTHNVKQLKDMNFWNEAKK